METTSLLEYVIAELETRRGRWKSISQAVEPKTWEAHYSWMTKVAQRQIPDPGVLRVQALAEWLRTHPTQEQAA